MTRIFGKKNEDKDRREVRRKKQGKELYKEVRTELVKKKKGKGNTVVTINGEVVGRDEAKSKPLSPAGCPRFPPLADSTLGWWVINKPESLWVGFSHPGERQVSSGT